MQQGNMKLHVKLSKFHIEHTPNGATVQHIHSKQDITTICPKQQLGILQVSKQHHKHSKIRMQQGNMKLHAKLSKFQNA